MPKFYVWFYDIVCVQIILRTDFYLYSIVILKSKIQGVFICTKVFAMMTNIKMFVRNINKYILIQGLWKFTDQTFQTFIFVCCYFLPIKSSWSMIYFSSSFVDMFPEALQNLNLGYKKAVIAAYLQTLRDLLSIS